jgi:D-alanyl-lipoteichoic acid acyltransferase DltB (MBOAT superfamily)
VNAASVSFLLFALIAATAYNLSSSSPWRQFAFLAANIYFLSTFSHDLASFVPLAVFVAVGFIGVRLMQGGQRRWFAPILALEIVMLIWLKKYSFLPEAGFLRFSYVTLGMSYILFRMLHLLIEARDARLVRVTLHSYLNYTLSFLTLVSGPIQRYADFAATQLADKRAHLGIADIGRAVERVAVGIFKVSLLSLLFLNIHEKGIGQLASAAGVLERVSAGLLLAAAYPIFLYMNFSGYMDIVIGLGRFFGFTLPENFDRPFSAPNFIIFWNRWHMTLSNFFKTYVFNPLLMSLMRRFSQRAEPFLAVLAFFFTFFLLGIWHGQTSVFAVYGLVLGLGVSVNKLYQLLLIRRLGSKHYKELSANSLYTAVCRGLTFTYFTFGLFFFWSNWAQMGELLSHVDAVSLVAIWLGLLLLATAVLAFNGMMAAWTASWKFAGQPVLASRYMRTALTTAVVVITVTVIALVDAPAPENVYRAF